jgi:hypothetical protein
MSDNIKNRQKSFSNLIALKFSKEELKAKFTNIQHLITLIGENDNYAHVLKTFEGIEADDVSITNAQALRNDFVKQLIEQLSEFNIHLQPTNSEIIRDRAVSQVA